MIEFYSSQSTVTDPGDRRRWIDAVPADLASIREAAARLVFHYWAYGDITGHGIDAGRIGEINLRYADALLNRAAELRPDSPLARRAPAERVVGCCRDHTVIFLAIARHHGIAARARYGFADYLMPGWWLDHMIPEVWDPAEGRWRLVEPEFEEGWTPPGETRPLPLTDMPRDRFLTGARAWRLCRDGQADPERFVVAPGIERPSLRSWPYLVHNVVFDLAAMNKQEMISWDLWGMLDSPQPPGEAAFPLADELAALLEDPALTPERLRAAYDDPALRVPPVVATYSPPDHRRERVALRPARDG
ncbi:transglutaminase domain-containing protein [Nonomuraea sp. SMC257]|uniref:Transglutaminase domain-containing protein n=1 Tax=Nonomuraea montanisoli TaxID=2741721 RepID=A0A7Y6M1B8_9ACTN|nr:transglutaminase-like domain-containing protein [Nonomuraea montanisoli]NUW30256.1 transglutaminase domain-containing protein [Nonomuraea montanisoli]